MFNIFIAKNKEDVYGFRETVLIVDFFRFSTTLNALLFRKKKIFIYDDENKVIEFVKKNSDYDVFSEKDLDIKKFDNSPFLALNREVKDKVIVITNSGSKATLSAKNAREIIIGSICNITAVKKHIENSKKDVLIVPAALFFNTSHIEDFMVCEFLRDYITVNNGDVKTLRRKIERTGRIEELKTLRKTWKEDVDIIFSQDIFKTLPFVKLRGDYGEVYDESSR